MKTIQLFIFLLITLSFQSCFDIIEQVDLSNDGSGNIQVTLNMSQSKTKLHSIMKLKSINGHPVPTQEEINTKIAEIKTTLAQTPGISDVKVTSDFDNYIGVISYHFSSIAQLNLSIRNVEIKEKAKPDMLNDYFSYDATKKVFTRQNKFQFKKLYETLSNADKEIFSAASYTAIYKFQSDVISVSNTSAKISPSKKAVMLHSSALDIITQKKVIENKIKLN